MSNTVKQKQKRTIIVSCVLAVLLLAGSLFVAIDGLLHMKDPYKSFADREFAIAIAEALGKDSVRDIEWEDLDKMESLIYYFDIGLDENNDYSTKFVPYVILGTKDAADAIINEETPPDGSYTVVSYPLTESEDILMFKNLRVLRAFDVVEVSEMQNGCLQTQYASYYGIEAETIDFNAFVNAFALNDLKKLDQLASLTKLEEISIEYSGITNLNGVEKFENLKKLDIGNTLVDDISALSEVKTLEILTAVGMGERTKTSEDEHTHEGLTDISALKELSNLRKVDLSYNAIKDLSPLSELKGLTLLGIDENCVENLDALKEIKTIEGFSAINNHLTNIDGIKGNTELTIFAVNGNENITDVSVLSECTKLETLAINDNKIETIGDLSKLTELKTFTANNNKIKDISSLYGCAKLETLTINDNEIETLTKDDKKLDSLDALVTVSIQNNKIKDLNAFNGCEKLETLTAYNNAFEGELDLTGCTALKSLDVHYEEPATDDKDEEVTDDKTDESTEDTENKEDEKGEDEKEDDKETVETPKTGLSALKITGLKSLTSVNASNNVITAIPDLTGCDALTTLNLNKNLVEKLDGIETSKSITTLNLANNKINDLSKISGVATLKTLELTGNAITDIKPLEKLTALTSLKLGDNADLEDISVFSSFPTTSSLDLNLIGTKAASNEEVIKELQTSHSSMKITYVAEKK